MKNLLSFEEFVNENNTTPVVEASDADGMDPKDSAKKSVIEPCASVSDLKPGKEYDVDGKSMLYQGVSDDVYVFNGKDGADAISMDPKEIEALVAKKGVSPVAEEVPAEETATKPLKEEY